MLTAETAMRSLAAAMEPINAQLKKEQRMNASAATVRTPASSSRSTCARRMPATRLRWSSASRRVRQLASYSHSLQCDTG